MTHGETNLLQGIWRGVKVQDVATSGLVRKQLRDEGQASDFIFRADYIEGAWTSVYTSNDVPGVTDSLFGVAKKSPRAGKNDPYRLETSPMDADKKGNYSRPFAPIGGLTSIAGADNRRSSIAMFAAAVRFSTPSLARILPMCVRTVRSPIARI